MSYIWSSIALVSTTSYNWIMRDISVGQRLYNTVLRVGNEIEWMKDTVANKMIV